MFLLYAGAPSSFEEIMAQLLTSVAYTTRLVNGLRELKNNGSLTDLNIIVDETQASYPVHKCVMVAASKYFATLIVENQLEDNYCLVKGIT